MAEEKNKVIKKARIEMNELTGDEAVRRLAELREKWEMDRRSDIDYAKEEGKAEGRIEGAKKEKRLIAKELLDQGVDIEIISNATGLSVQEIEGLK